MNDTSIIYPDELNSWLEQGKKFQLVDIDTENLLESFDIQVDWIPITAILDNLSKIRSDIPVVLCCRRGNDSFMLMNLLQQQFNMANVLSLKTGVFGWKPELDMGFNEPCTVAP